MVIQQKVRGHRRRWKQIARWQEDYMSVDLLDYLQNVEDKFYAKIRVHPWSGISLVESKVKEPTGKTKQKMLEGLLAIYDDWKKQLDTLGQPYYLKIWLFEPRFSNSQVVCAIGEGMQQYSNPFREDEVKGIPVFQYGKLNDDVKAFHWEQGVDEDHYDDYVVGEPELYESLEDFEQEKKWFNRLLKKQHRTQVMKGYDGEELTVYSFTRGKVWVGAR